LTHNATSGEILDKYLYEPRHKHHVVEAADANVQALMSSGVLNIPETKYLNIPKVVLFGFSVLSGTIATYSVVYGKSARLLAVSYFIAAESLRISYNTYMGNTLSLLAKRIADDPEMVNEAVAGIVTAEASKILEQGLENLGTCTHTHTHTHTHIHTHIYMYTHIHTHTHTHTGSCVPSLSSPHHNVINITSNQSYAILLHIMMTILSMHHLCIIK
jgi:hypothetical protein